MRLSTRFSLGVALATLPLVGIIVYSVETTQALAERNERLTARQLVGTQVGSGVVPRLNRLREYQHKYAVSQDEGYARKYQEIVDAVDGVLEATETYELSPSEADALEQLNVAWSTFSQDASLTAPPQRTGAALGRLRDLAITVQDETRAVAQQEAEVAAEVRARTRWTAIAGATGAVILSFSLLLLTARWIRNRLDHFIAGTQAVSKGAFSFRLEEHGGDELAQVARSFNRMVQALDQLERLKSDLISSVSHELKTPLVAMVETNRLLLDEVPGPLTARQRRMLSLNTQAAQRLSNMISDLLELSRLKANIRYRMSEQELVGLTQRAASEFEALAHERDVTLCLNLPGIALFSSCDPDRYVQVVQNLLENALRHTPGGGRVEVTLSRSWSEDLANVLPDERSTTSDVFALLTVDDTGCGIPSVDRNRVFEKFFRRNGQPSDGGVGLGLAICREIVTAHKGQIWVADGRLPGASVRVALPVERVGRSVAGAKA